MVCSVGSVKMAVMARILSSGNISWAVTAEKAGCQKLVGQYIQKELLEADDANLLDEEDMFLFDLNPLTDPLHLVSCSICKKPVKATQFVVHAELCRTLGLKVEPDPEHDSCTRNRKCPKKERKKLSTAGNQVTSTWARERFAIPDAPETPASSTQLADESRIASSSEKAKEIPEKIFASAVEMVSLTMHPKLVLRVASPTAQTSDDLRTASDVPAPLVTKTYYSQRNNRLHAAILDMCHQPSMMPYNGDKRESQGSLISYEASPEIFSDEHFVDRSEKFPYFDNW